MILKFFTAMSFGFMLGICGVVYVLGPQRVQAEICQGYVHKAKSLKLSREEKVSYVEKFYRGSGARRATVGKKSTDRQKQPTVKTTLKTIPKKTGSMSKSTRNKNSKKFASTKKNKKPPRRKLSSNMLNFVE